MAIVRNFANDSVGSGLPSGMTSRWGDTDTTWSTVTGPDSDPVLQLEMASAGRRAASLDAADGLTDVSAVVVTRSSVRSNNESRLYVRGSGAASSEEGAYIELNQDSGVPEVAVKYYDGGSSGTFDSFSFDWNADEWVALRLELDGSDLRARAWKPADERDPLADEPGTWDYTTTQTTVPGAGWVGLGAFQSNGDNQFAWVQVENLSGEAVTANTGGVTVAGETAAVTTTENRVVAAPLGALTATGLQAAAQVSEHQQVSAPTGAAGASGLTADVALSDHQQVSADAGAVSATGFATNVLTSDQQTLVPGAGEVRASGVTPQVMLGELVAAPVGAVAASGASASVSLSDNQVVAAPTGAVSASALLPRVDAPVEARLGSAAFAGVTPSVQVETALAATIEAPLGVAALEPLGAVQVFPSVAHQRASLERRVWVRPRDRSTD